MSRSPLSNPDSAAALDRALAHALRAPELPAGFHARLALALELLPPPDRATARHTARVEHARMVGQLHANFLRACRRTLCLLLGIALTAGAVLLSATPRFSTAYDAHSLQGVFAVLLPLTLGAAVAVAMAFAAWLRRADLAEWWP